MLSTATNEGTQASSLLGKKGGCIGIPKGSGVALKSGGPPYSPTVGPELLTKEGTTVQTDGGLAGDLSPIKNCIVELVREGEGLWAAEDRRVRSGSALG